jgi:Conserved TM helix
MWDKFVFDLTQATQEIVRNVAQLIPRLMVMLLIVLIGWVVAYAFKSILRSILRLAKFDRLSEDTGATQFLRRAALPSITEILSRFIFWIAWIGFILVGVSVLGIASLQPHISNFFGFLPRLFVALFVMFFGLLASSFFSRAALLASVNAGLPAPRLIASIIRTMLVVFTVSVAFEELGLAERTVSSAFMIIFGALMLGLAIAFGLGGRDLAKQFLERRFLHDHREEEREDELSPL